MNSGWLRVDMRVPAYPIECHLSGLTMWWKFLISHYNGNDAFIMIKVYFWIHTYMFVGYKSCESIKMLYINFRKTFDAIEQTTDYHICDGNDGNVMNRKYFFFSFSSSSIQHWIEKWRSSNEAHFQSLFALFVHT